MFVERIKIKLIMRKLMAQSSLTEDGWMDVEEMSSAAKVLEILQCQPRKTRGGGKLVLIFPCTGEVHPKVARKAGRFGGDLIKNVFSQARIHLSDLVSIVFQKKKTLKLIAARLPFLTEEMRKMKSIKCRQT